MKKRPCLLCAWFLTISIFHLLLVNAVASAGGFKDDDFSLRLPAAITRFASYGDVAAGGGASAGSQWSSSVNPAAVAWRKIEKDVHVSSSPQYSALLFNEGTILHVATISATQDLGDYGVIQPTFAKIWTNRETMRDGTVFELGMNYGQVQWAKRFSPRWSFGINFNAASSDVDNDIGRFITADSSSDTYGFRTGALYKATDQLLLGLVVDLASSSSDTDIFILGRRFIDLDDDTSQVLVRPGLSFEYKKESSILLDYQYGRFSNDTGRLTVHRFYAGIDHGVYKGLFGRLGLAFDKEGNFSWTCGVGIYPSKLFGLDFGYQYDMFPELNPEFGRAQTLTLSLGLQF